MSRGLAITTWLALSAASLAATAAPARAQANVEVALAEAIRLHERLEVERSLVVLRQIVSPGTPYEVTRDQRVRAYVYIGAALALKGQVDSAVVYYRAALERDPFTDLDVQRFTVREQAPFAEARRQLFALGLRGVRAQTFDPATERLGFTYITTHLARIRMELASADGAVVIRLLDGESEGLREVTWNGLLPDGRLAPAGRYEITVRGESARTARTDSARAYFDVGHVHPALEELRPPLGDAELLPERHPPSAASRELAKGLAIAAGAVAIPVLLSHSRLEPRDQALSTAAAGIGVGVGVAAFVVRHRQRTIPANVAENQRRRLARDLENLEIRRRNAERLTATRLAIGPAAGIPR